MLFLQLTLAVLIIICLTGSSVESSSRRINSNVIASGGQSWSVQIEVEPGETGSLKQDITAAEGPYDGKAEKASDVDDDSFGFVIDKDGKQVVVKGKDYVGSFFHVEQSISNSGGTTRRYIDVSSPWSHGFLREVMNVIGELAIDESFSMNNLSPGTSTTNDWFSLF